MPAVDLAIDGALPHNASVRGWRLIVALLIGAGAACSSGDIPGTVSRPLGSLDSGAEVSLQSSTRIPINESVCVSLSGRTQCVSWHASVNPENDWGLAALSLAPVRDDNSRAGSVQFVALTPTDAVLEMDTAPVITESTLVHHQGQDRMIWRMVFADVGTSVSGCARTGASNVRIGASFHTGAGAATAMGSTASRC